MNAENIFLDTTDYTEDYEQDFMIEDLMFVLDLNTKKPNGEVVNWILASERSSHYGEIANNGATGYRDLKTTDLGGKLLFASNNSERVVVGENNGELQVTYYDHDGAHTCSIKSVPKSKEAQYENFEFKSFDEQLAFVDKLSSLKIKKIKTKPLQKA